MGTQKIEISRPLVGLLALACLVAAAAVQVFHLGSHDSGLWTAAFVRVGLVLGAFWLAMPTRDRAPAWANVSPWTFVGLLLAIYAVARYPRAVLPVLVMVAIVGFFLRPRPKRRPPVRS